MTTKWGVPRTLRPDSGLELVRNSTSIGLKGITPVQDEHLNFAEDEESSATHIQVGSAREIFLEVNAEPILKDQMVERIARDLV